MHLTVIVHRHHPNQRDGPRVACHQHATDRHPGGTTCLLEQSPAVAVIVLRVQVGCEVDDYAGRES